MDIRKTNFGRFTHCYECSIADMKLIITADVGPRIVSLDTGKSGNILYHDADEKHSFGDWKMYGGSRLWAAPETAGSYEPDNTRCDVREEKESITISGQGTGKALVRSITVREKNGHFDILFTIANTGKLLVDCALWSITCVLPSGTVFFPWGTEVPGWELKKVVYWRSWIGHSTNVESGQYVHGNDLFLIKPTGEEGKVGTAGYGGFIGITTDRYTFIKKYERIQSASYTDDGCAAECYTCKDFVELETLSPLRTILPGTSACHEEEWIMLDTKVDVRNGEEIRTLVHGKR